MRSRAAHSAALEIKSGSPHTSASTKQIQSVSEEIARVPIQHVWDLPTHPVGSGGLVSNASADSRSAIDWTMAAVSSAE